MILQFDLEPENDNQSKKIWNDAYFFGKNQ